MRALGAGFIFLLFAGLSQSAADPTVTGGNVHVIPLDSKLPVEGLAGPGVVIHRVPPPRPATDTTPDPIHRDRVFEQAGLAPELKALDQLDLDLLYQRALTYSLVELQKTYPRISAKKLARLQEAQKEPK